MLLMMMLNTLFIVKKFLRCSSHCSPKAALEPPLDNSDSPLPGWLPNSNAIFLFDGKRERTHTEKTKKRELRVLRCFWLAGWMGGLVCSQNAASPSPFYSFGSARDLSLLWSLNANWTIGHAIFEKRCYAQRRLPLSKMLGAAFSIPCFHTWNRNEQWSISQRQTCSYAPSEHYNAHFCSLFQVWNKRHIWINTAVNGCT